MFPPHRPAVESTSNAAQPSSSASTPSAGVGLATKTSESSSRIRKDVTTDVRVGVGRHRDKLELIRDSLRPFEQTNLTDASIPMLSTSSPISSEDETRRQIMINTLVQIGFEENAALLALRLVRYSSVAAAAEVLLNLKKEHVFRQGPVGNICIGGQTSMISNLDESSLSRPNSPLAGITNAPTTSISSSVVKIGSSSFLQTSADNYHFQCSPQINVKSSINNYDFSATPSPSQMTILPLSTSLHSEIIRNRKPNQALIQQSSSLLINEKNMQENEELRPLSPMPIGRNFNDGGNVSVLRRSYLAPTIKSRFDKPLNAKVLANPDGSHLKLDFIPHCSNIHAINGIDEGDAEIAGCTNEDTDKTNGVQKILVDPDRTPVHITYIDQIRHRVKVFNMNEQLAAAPFSEIIDSCHRTSFTSSSVNSAESSADSDIVTRCESPLPESVHKKIRNKLYESEIKQCKPKLFCFYMEQHVERLIQQYKQRQQRARQLAKEMECANLPESMREHMLNFLTQKESRYLRLKRQKMNRHMFELVKHIGFGAFGRVSLVKKKDTGQVYAMKKLLKKDVIMKRQAAHVKAERDILAEADSEWIVKLFFSFQDELSLYLIMEYVPGGDMMQLLINKGVFYEKLARFYIAELTCAVEYVHGLGFIHRDIKPDNILIDQLGHIKLTDFGLCTGLRWTHDKRYYGPDNEEIEGVNGHKKHPSTRSSALKGFPKLLDVRNHCKRNQSHSLVGTDNYMAPEVIRGTGHTQLCDLWSIGVILYEMVFGRPPFLSEDRYETQYKIIKWRQYLDFSSRIGMKLSLECIDLIKKLCCEQEDRLGSVNGAAEVKAHSWFKAINFFKLRSIRAEFIPRVEHAEDTSNFDTFEFDSSDQAFDTMAKRATTAPSFNPAFYEFTFRHFFDFDGQGCPSLKTQRRPSLAPLFEANAAVLDSAEDNNNDLAISLSNNDCYESDDSLVV